MGAGLDPGSNCGNFFGSKFLALAGRHDFLFAVFFEATFDHLNDQTIGALAGKDRGAELTAFHQGFEIFQDELAFGIFCGMAIQAMGIEDSIYRGVIDFRLGGFCAQGGEDEESDKNCRGED